MQEVDYVRGDRSWLEPDFKVTATRQTFMPVFRGNRSSGTLFVREAPRPEPYIPVEKPIDQ